MKRIKTTKNFVDYLQNLNNSDLPGNESHLKLAPKFGEITFRKFKKSEDAKNSSVMILISGTEELKILFTLRSSNLRHHGGQISFPGGKNDPGESNIQTAIRETYEETCIKVEDNEILCFLTQLYVPPSNSFISPVVAYKPEISNYLPNDGEVDEIFFIKINELLNSSNFKRVVQNLDGFDIETPYWDIHPTTKLWGATSMILKEFLDIYEKWVER
jgi:8-oxo-dGTP pyrophosphatase MutT (NUDIX family)